MKRALAAVVLVAALTGCGSGDTTATEKPLTEAVRLAEDQGRSIADLAGRPLVWADGSPWVHECAEGTYSYEPAFNLFFTDRRAGDFVPALHGNWQAAGWEITRYEDVGTGWILVGLSPVTHVKVRVDSLSDDRVLITIDTPCYRDPSGAVTFGPLA